MRRNNTYCSIQFPMQYRRQSTQKNTNHKCCELTLTSGFPVRICIATAPAVYTLLSALTLPPSNSSGATVYSALRGSAILVTSRRQVVSYLLLFSSSSSSSKVAPRVNLRFFGVAFAERLLCWPMEETKLKNAIQKHDKQNVLGHF